MSRQTQKSSKDQDFTTSLDKHPNAYLHHKSIFFSLYQAATSSVSMYDYFYLSSCYRSLQSLPGFIFLTTSYALDICYQVPPKLPLLQVEVKIYSVNCIPLIHSLGVSSQKAIRLFRNNLSFGKSMLAIPSHLLHGPRNGCQEHLHHDFPKDQKAGKSGSIHHPSCLFPEFCRILSQWQPAHSSPNQTSLFFWFLWSEAANLTSSSSLPS